MKLSSCLAPALALLISLSIGCADATQPGEPPVIVPPVAPPAPRAAVIATYQRLGELSPRYVLLADGYFTLEYDEYRGGVTGYPGTYSRADTVITFTFELSTTAYAGFISYYPRWEATGALRGDTLTVKYNDGMTWLLTDFMDSDLGTVFVRTH